MKRIISILGIACAILSPTAGTSTTGDSYSYSLYAKVLNQFVDESGRVDYSRLKMERNDLDAYIQMLADADLVEYETWPDNAQIAFWLNAYNALILRTIIDNYPIKSSFIRSFVYPRNSIRQIAGVWDKIVFSVMGGRYTFDQIEHQTLRQKFSEPRIHMALVCAAKSCPNLRKEPYEGSNLDFQLESQTRTFLSYRRNYAIDREKHTVYLSSIFKWYGKDFVGLYRPVSGFTNGNPEEMAVLYFVSLHVPEEDKLYLAGSEYAIRYLKYDWSLNERVIQ